MIHCEKLASHLNQRAGLIRRMRYRIPTDKLLIISEAIFNSKIRNCSSVYLQPVFEKEDLKARKVTPETYKLQVIQNDMWRIVFKYQMGDKTTMEKLRNSVKILSVNQIVCYALRSFQHH